MFSSKDSKGTMRIPEPKLEVISKKLYVTLSTVAVNGGGAIFGSPASTEPEVKKKKGFW